MEGARSRFAAGAAYSVTLNVLIKSAVDKINALAILAVQCHRA
jgi:hypothetical protein